MSLNERSSSSSSQFTILALTRSKSSPPAVALAAMPGVTVLEGDLDHPAEIFEAALRGGPLDGVFSVQVRIRADPKLAMEMEVRQGSQLADWAATLGAHLVFSGTDFLDMDDTGIWM